MKILNYNRKDILKLFPQNMTIAEIGTDKGTYASCINYKTKPKELFLIDCWEHIISDSVYSKLDPVNSKDEKQNEKYVFVQNRFKKFQNVKIIRQFSYDAIKHFDDKFFDCVYIDGDHSYDGCLNDLRLYHTKIKDDGFIWGHDFTNCFKWIQVKEAIATFIDEHPEWELYAITNEEPKKSPSWFLVKNNSKIKDYLK